VYPVNPFYPSVQAITAYPSVKKIPRQIDLAIIALPAHIVPQIVEECGESGITGIVIVSSGFSEVGPRGRVLEEEILKLAGKKVVPVMVEGEKVTVGFGGGLRFLKPGRWPEGEIKKRTMSI